MAKVRVSESLVDDEIRALIGSDYVRLAQKARKVRQKRRLYLRYLRHMDKLGRALAASGTTMHDLVQMEQIEESYLGDGIDDLYSEED